MKNLTLKSFRLQNFKAVKDSKIIKFTPLTVFIGNNGSGKSSLIEGLETLKDFITEDIDYAMQQWKGIEHIRNKFNKSKHLNNSIYADPIIFDFSGTGNYIGGNKEQVKYKARIEINSDKANNEIFITNEIIEQNRMIISRDINKNFKFEKSVVSRTDILPNESILKNHYFDKLGSNWQFLSLLPQDMGLPKPQKRTNGEIKLLKDGSNIAEFLLTIRKLDINAFNGIIDALKYVLPYANDLQPSITSELERSVYLQLSEQNFKIPGWLLSTGTLRILALLSVLRHPTPPPLIVIEELENGLDPRTIIFILEEIRMATDSGIQVIITTHSPYLLDLIPLEFIVFVERVNGKTVFSKPANQESINKWAEDFSPGRLYTMGKFMGNNQI